MSEKLRGWRLAAAAALIAASGASCGGEPARSAFDPADTSEQRDAGGGTLPAEGGEPLSACEEARLRSAPAGCEYIVFPVPDGSGSNEGCTAIFVSNPSERPARLEIDRDGQVFDLGPSARLLTTTMSKEHGYADLPGDTLPAGASAVVALVQNSGPQLPLSEYLGRCPFPPLLDESKRGAHDMSDVAAFRVRSTEPVFATYVQPYAYWPLSNYLSAITATTALRSSGSWDTHGIDVGVFKPGRPPVQHELAGNPITDDMAGFLALGSFSAARVEVQSAGGFQHVDIAPGHVVRIKRDDLLIGSTFTSDVPIATFAGAPTAFLPYDFGGGDPLLTHVPGRRSWASEYAAVPYPPRYDGVRDPAIYRIVGTSDGTHLSYEPTRPEEAPETIEAGQLAVFMTDASFVVRSQDAAHRFYLSMAMTSYEYVQPHAEWETGIQGRGDPELISVVGRSEFANRFAFATEHGFPDVHLVLIRAKENGAYHAVSLDCAGEVQGWKPVGNGDTYETATVTLSSGAFEPQVYAGGTCHNGPHQMESSGPLTGYAWGWGHKGAFVDNPDADGGGTSFGFALYGVPNVIAGPGR